MRSKLYTPGLMLILSALVLSGCGPTTAQPTKVPPPVVTKLPIVVPLTLVPAITPTVAVEASDVQGARDAALVYLSERYGEQAPPLGLNWAEEYTTPEGLVGSATFEFTFEDWVVTVTYAILPPERTVYQVVVANQATGSQWEGKVDATGQVIEQTASEGEWFDAARARDATLAYIRQRYGLGWSGDGAPSPRDLDGRQRRNRTSSLAETATA